MRKLKFIDLFAGLGGFHLALQSLGHKCVFASELNDELRELYTKNHKTKIEGDINLVDVSTIPSHDILCAGFPCQPFSKAEAQLGLEDPVNGNLFYKIMEILTKHKPEYIFLENVANLHGHDEGNTWQVIHTELSKLYDVKEDILGVPLSGRALRCNLFVRSSQKGFPLQSLTQKTTSNFYKQAA